MRSYPDDTLRSSDQIRTRPTLHADPMRRLSLVALPFLAAFALVFGLFYLYTAIQLAARGFAIRAALVGVFGVVGIGLAAGIWIARKRLMAARAAAASAGSREGPPA